MKKEPKWPWPDRMCFEIFVEPWSNRVVEVPKDFDLCLEFVMYKLHNGNLLFHGCIPMDKDGNLLTFTIGGKERSDKEFLDYADRTARKPGLHLMWSPGFCAVLRYY